MSYEKRDTHAVAGVAEDATEVLPSQAYSQAVAPADDDATVVLPARSASPRSDSVSTQPGSGASGQASADATLPLARSEVVPGSGSWSAPGAQQSAGSAQDAAPPTQPLPAGQRLGQVREKLQQGTATGAAAAKTGFAAARARAKETAARVKQERAARAAQKKQKTANGAQQSVPSQAAPYPARPATRLMPTGTHPGSRPGTITGMQGSSGLTFGGQMSNSYTPPVTPAVPNSTENSPSGRLQMLTPSHIRQTRPSLWTLIQHFFAAGSLGFLLFGTFAFFIYSELGQRLDEVSYQEFSYRFMTYTQQTSRLLDMIPATAGVIAGIGILFVLVWKHRFVPALVGVAIAAGANITTQLLKNYFIVKPNLGVQEVVSNSAPSGHTTFAAAAGLALFLASPKRFRPTVALLSMVFTIAAGYSTIVNAWHRPSDVVAAILVTGLWGILGLIILRFMRSEELDMSNTLRSGLILVPLLSITGFFMGFCAVALYAVTHYNPIPGSAFIAALCLIGSIACITTSVQIALLRPQNKQRSPYRRVWAY